MSIAAQFDPFANPFAPTTDADRHALWQILIARDSEAFVEANWSICEADFAPQHFEGINARGSLNPIEWTLSYPHLESYRDDWLRMAGEFQDLSFANVTHREYLYQVQQFAKVELSSNRAVVWKQFQGDELLTTGDRHQISAQSVYRLHRIDGQWKIVGFVGYLPLEQLAS